jgi:hypothetical protein
MYANGLSVLEYYIHPFLMRTFIPFITLHALSPLYVLLVTCMHIIVLASMLSLYIYPVCMHMLVVC